MSQTKMFYQDEVDAGARRLDREDPKWASRINLRSLGMSRKGYCVLGQLFGDYKEGKEHLVLSENVATNMGFNIGLAAFPVMPFAYAVLKAAWSMLIEERQRKGIAA